MSVGVMKDYKLKTQKCHLSCHTHLDTSSVELFHKATQPNWSNFPFHPGEQFFFGNFDGPELGPL
jgi:hypothetical protein